MTLNSEKMPDGEQYLLPITIEQIKGDDAAQTSDEGNVYYILFNKRVLPPAQLLDREGWKVVHCTSEYTPGEGNPKTGGPRTCSTATRRAIGPTISRHPSVRWSTFRSISSSTWARR